MLVALSRLLTMLIVMLRGPWMSRLGVPYQKQASFYRRHACFVRLTVRTLESVAVTLNTWTCFSLTELYRAP